MINEINKIIKFKVLSLSFSHINLSKLVNLASALFFIPFTSFNLVFFSYHPFLTSCLKIANKFSYHSAPVLWNSLSSDLRHVAHHVTSSPTLNSPVSGLSTSLLLYVKKPIFSTVLFLLSLCSPRLSMISQVMTKLCCFISY